MARRKIAFLLEDFATGAPSQQLLDRFLMGYARDGEFRRSDWEVAVWLAAASGKPTADANALAGLAKRRREFNLSQDPDLAKVLNAAERLIAVAAADKETVTEGILRRAIEQLPAGAACFVHGALAANLASARQLTSAAAARQIVLTSATSVATAFRLPDQDVAPGVALSEALIIVQGPRPLAELWGIDGLSPLIARRPGGESGIRSVRAFAGREVWGAAKRGQWSWPLLAAAISRSNTTQGDPVRDGRTQDLVGLGLVQKLARNPRGWTIEHRDDLHTAILVLDGAVSDINFAVRTRDGAIISAQLYRPPAPQRAEFDRLTALLDDFFATTKSPWPIERDLLIADFLGRMPMHSGFP